MTDRVEAFCAWAGPIGAIMMGIALWPAAHFIPPLAPSLPPAEVAAIYQANASGIKLASILMLFALTGLTTFYVGISLQISRMTGDAARKWSSVQLTLGAISLVPLYPTSLSWGLAAFRPDRSLEAIRLLNDTGWFNFIMPIAPAVIQLFAIGFATLADKGAAPIYPRWLGFLSFWVGLLFLPGMVIPFFMTGVFAWNGLLTFWLPAFVLGNYVMTMAVLMLKAARRTA